MARKRLDTLGRVMRKVSLGRFKKVRLTRFERKIIGAAVDGAKKAKSEKRKNKNMKNKSKKCRR